jgi:integrase
MNAILQHLLDETQETDAILRNDTKQLAQWLEEHYPQIHAVLSGQSNEAWKANDVVRVVNELLREMRPPAHAIRLIGLFANAVVGLNRRRNAELAPLYVPAIPIARRRPANPWIADTPKHIREARQMRSALVNMLCNPISDDAAGSIMSLLIPSAIFFGGLLHKDSLVALVRAIAAPGFSTLPCSGRPQIELRIAWRNQANAERRLWHPDVVSSLLLLRFQAKLEEEVGAFSATLAAGGKITDREIMAWVWKSALAPLRKHARAFRYAPESLAALLRRVEALYRLDLPKVVVSYMTREFLSNSVRRSTLSRIHEISLPQDEAPESTDESDGDSAKPDDAPEARQRNYQAIELDWMAQFRGALRKKERAALIKALSQFAAQCPHPPGKRTAEFALFLLKERSAGNHYLATSTILRYTSIVASRLACLLENADPKEPAVATLLSTYLKILDEASAEGARKSLRHVVASALFEFHVFLSKVHHVESIDARELGIGQAMAGSVDANLITELEYQAMQRKIRSGSSGTLDQIFFRAAALVLMLGFRCGMRRGEILWLRHCDLVVDPYTQEITEIVVRPWERHELKSRNAARRLPVEALLDKEERAELEWWRRNGPPEQPPDNGQLLFGGLGTTKDLAPEIRIFAIVLDAIRNESGDMALRFHHCRHSAATQLFLRLFLRDTKIPEDSLPARLLAGRTNPPRIDALYETLCGVKNSTRKAMFAISLIIGHSSAEVTLEYYIHCMDSLQGILLDRRAIPNEKVVLAAISGLSRSAAYSNMHAFGKTGLVQRLMPSPPASPSRQVQPQAPNQESLQWVARLWNFLYRADDPSRQLPLEDLAAEHGFDATRACTLVDRATLMRDMTAPWGGFSFPMTTLAASEKRRLYCPRKPHLEINRGLARDIAPVMYRLFSHNPKLAGTALGSWVERSHGGGAQIRFHELSEAVQARRYRNFLVKLGVPYRWIVRSAGEGSQQLEKWRKKINIQDCESIHIESAGAVSEREVVKWIAIEPYFPEILKVAGPSRINGYEGFRFLQMMAWIYLA